MFTEADFEKLVCKILGENGWKYIPADSLARNYSDVLVEPMVKDALIRLNPVIAEDPARADEVLQRIRAIILSVEPHSLITHNEQFKNLVFENNSFHFGKDGRDVPIAFFGTGDDVDKNEYVVTNQWVYPRAEGGKRLDIVLLINGFPVAVGELKTPTREAISWMDGAGDILAYEKSIPQMFVTNIFNFASEGKTFRYSSINAPLSVWGPWHTNGHKSEGTLKDVEHSIKDMMTPENIMDIFRFYTLYATDKEYRKYKIICRYQQFEGANMIVDRVLQGKPKQGLIWHFQGSGKSLLMVFAAQKLRMTKSLNNPTVLIVDDRIDLETQMTATFNASDIPNLEKAYSGERLTQLLKGDSRKIIITTIFKFNDVSGCLNARDNIILMVDEAHRTQEGSLGEKMRAALPNAFFFGLTGTPINKRDRNTFHAFGAVEDKSGYMSKYSFADSIRDGATLPLNFEPVPVELHVNQDAINEEFEAMAQEAGLTKKQKNDVISRVHIEAIMKNPERIRKVCEHIADHYKTKVEPNGFKGQVVCYDRECCVLYKQELDKLLGEEASTIVMDTNNDKEDRYKKWRRDRDEESKVLDQFRNPRTKLKLVIVTSKLLTGFDAPILQVMYLDKPMKDHTLLQAICRTNRVYGHDKSNGLIVDYVGIFDDVAKALDFDEKSVQSVISNIESVKKEMPRSTSASKFKEILAVVQDENPDDIYADILQVAVERFAKYYIVSRQSAKLRLMQFGFTEVAGTFDFVDGSYIRPYSFKEGILEQNQTFTVSALDAAIQRNVDPVLNELTKDGSYLFVENHFVFNTPLYIQLDEEGSLSLTEYARSHMEECCLIFNLNVTSQIDKDYYSFCFINREANVVNYETTYCGYLKYATPEKQIESRRKVMEDCINIRSQMTDNPVQCFDLIMAWCNVSMIELANKSGVGLKTIQRIKTTGECSKPNNLLRICFALNLPPMISSQLLYAYRCQLNQTKTEDQWIQEALNTKYPESLPSILRWLGQFNVSI